MGKLSLKPLADRLVVEPIEEQERTDSGLYLPETARERPQQGNVIAVGPGAWHTNGDVERLPLDVSEGDRVLFAKYAGTDIQLDGRDMNVLRESDVLAIVE